MSIKTIVRIVQSTSSADEIECLEKKQPVKVSSRLRRLQPVLVDGILRVGGRIDESIMSYDEKHPVILPKEHSHQYVGYSSLPREACARRPRAHLINDQAAFLGMSSASCCETYYSQVCNLSQTNIKEDGASDGRLTVLSTDPV